MKVLFLVVGFLACCLPGWTASTLQVGSGCVSGCSGDPNFSGQHADNIDIWDSSGGSGFHEEIRISRTQRGSLSLERIEESRIDRMVRG